LLGLAAGAGFTGLTYLGLLAIPSRYIFMVTTILISLLAAGMAAQAVKFLDQAGFVTVLGEMVWDTSAWLPEGSILGKLLHVLIGYSEQPTLMQVLVYLGVLAAMTLLMRLAAPVRPLPVRSLS
jgi:high-affinity iron transporter